MAGHGLLLLGLALAVAGDEDILRLEIAMRDARGVRGVLLGSIESLISRTGAKKRFSRDSSESCSTTRTSGVRSSVRSGRSPIRIVLFDCQRRPRGPQFARPVIWMSWASRRTLIASTVPPGGYGLTILIVPV